MVKNVLVLGGGSAGFMAALALKVRLPDLSVTVLRSRDIGIIGVGEGSTVGLTRFLHDFLKVSSKRFYDVARPTWKLGLKFLWGPRPYFHYTFGAEQMHHRYPDLPRNTGYYCDEDMEYADPISALMTHDRAFERGPGGAPKFHVAVAYHFENERFVAFLEGYATALGVKIVEGTVREVRLHESGEQAGGVAGLALASGATATADLFVDASGFRSELLGRALGEPFVPFKSSLFCERAVVGGWDRKDSPDPQDQVIKPYTTCETMDSGWAWQIEHESRINRGYVYAPAFITDEDAEREFRAANPRVGPTRVVKFVSGRYERGWVKNVVAIGNASGFVEPLEATALGVIAVQSQLLADSLTDAGRVVRPTQAAEYNQYHAANWDSIRGFLAIHYRFNTRRDTPFWQACRADADLAGAARVVDYYRENGPSVLWSPTLFESFDSFGVAGFLTLLVGQRVPYAARHAPTPVETQRLDARRQRHREAAGRAMTVREALAVVHSPRWKWTKD